MYVKSFGSKQIANSQSFFDRVDYSGHFHGANLLR